MLRLIILFVYILTLTQLSGQQTKIRLLTNLDEELMETSGLIYFDNNYWTINDSGNHPCLYRFDRNGSISQTLTIANAENVDWEALAQDEHYIYIGDLGNNNGKRREFVIYRLAKKEINKNSKRQSILAKAFVLRYENQKENLKPYAHDFDCEALVSMNGKLGVFTKNWASGNSNFYMIDLHNKTAIMQQSFDTIGLITDANYSKQDDTMYLIGYQSINRHFFPFMAIIRQFSNKSEQKLFRYQLSELNGNQTEGICLSPDGIVISNESTHQFPASIHAITLMD